MSATKESFSQILENAKRSLPKLGDNSEIQAQARALAEELQYYVELLLDPQTTAADLGIGTRSFLHEIADQVGRVADSLAPDTQDVRAILEQIRYFEE
ncbi:MAG: hypothetical protein U0175_27280 [Caldilineaceae bacterium]